MLIVLTVFLLVVSRLYFNRVASTKKNAFFWRSFSASSGRCVASQFLLVRVPEFAEQYL